MSKKFIMAALAGADPGFAVSAFTGEGLGIASHAVALIVK